MSFLESQAYGYAGGTLTLWGVFASLSEGRSGDRALLAVLALATLLCLLYGLWLTGLTISGAGIVVQSAHVLVLCS